MKKLASYGVVALFLAAVLGLAAPSSAADPAVQVRVDRDEVRSGQTFRATATAKVECQWLVQWNGQRRVATGKRFTGIFVAPVVTGPERLPLRATCFHRSATPAPATALPGGGAQVISVQVPARTRGGVTITVLPPKDTVAPPQPQQPDTPGPGGLPNTGGPAWWLLLTATAALLAGVVTVRRTTRRVES